MGEGARVNALLGQVEGRLTYNVNLVTGRKNQPPLWLDMSFTEALNRFAGTSLAETKAAEAATATKRKAEDSSPPPVVPAPGKRGRPPKLRPD